MAMQLIYLLFDAPSRVLVARHVVPSSFKGRHLVRIWSFYHCKSSASRHQRLKTVPNRVTTNNNFIHTLYLLVVKAQSCCSAKLMIKTFRSTDAFCF